MGMNFHFHAKTLKLKHVSLSHFGAKNTKMESGHRLTTKVGIRFHEMTPQCKHVSIKSVYKWKKWKIHRIPTNLFSENT